MEKRKEFWRALPFVMALLLLTLVPMQSASALFGKGKEEAKAVDARRWQRTWRSRSTAASRMRANFALWTTRATR